MQSFSNRNKSKRPKFLLNFKINELYNIPQSAGVCYIKWNLKDGTGLHGRVRNKVEIDSSKKQDNNSNNNNTNNSLENGSRPGSTNNSPFVSRRPSTDGASRVPIGRSTSNSIQRNSTYAYGQKNDSSASHNSKMDVSSPTDNSPLSSSFPSSSSSSSFSTTQNVEVTGQSRGCTSRIPVQNHRCEWDYKLQKPILIKLNVNKDRKVDEKIFFMECYFEFYEQKASNKLHDSSSSNNGENGTKLENNTMSTLESDYRAKVFGKSVSKFHRRTGSLETFHKHHSENGDDNAPDNDKDNDSESNHSHPSKSNTPDSSHLGNSLLSTSTSSSSTTSSTSTASSGKKTLGKILLGSISINLSDYISPHEEFQTNRFLLQKSKINSILSFSCQLKLVRGSYQDFELPVSLSSGQLPNSLKQLGDKTSPACAPSSPLHTTTINTTTNTNGVGDSQALLFSTYSDLQNGTSAATDHHSTLYSNVGACSIHEVRFHLSNPLMEILYEKTCQIPWNQNPYALDPKSCVEDILEGGDGWNSNKLSKREEVFAKTADKEKDKDGDNSNTQENEKHTRKNRASSKIDTVGDMYKTGFTTAEHDSLQSSSESSLWKTDSNRNGNEADERGADTEDTFSFTETSSATSLSDSDNDIEADDMQNKNKKYVYIDVVKNSLRNELIDTRTWKVGDRLD